MKIKYNRVSNGYTQSGNRFDLDKEIYSKTYLDKCSGLIKFKERQYGSIIYKDIENGKVNHLVVEELSRLGRNTADVMNMLEFLEEHNTKLDILNNSIFSHNPDGSKNKTFNLICGILSNLYAQECENIRERCAMGREAYRNNNGGKWGRSAGSVEDRQKFLSKPKSVKIASLLKQGKSVKDIAGRLGVSNTTVSKVRKYLGMTSPNGPQHNKKPKQETTPKISANPPTIVVEQSVPKVSENPPQLNKKVLNDGTTIVEIDGIWVMDKTDYT